MQLTDEQNAIIRASLSHAVITAVAGSGKTTTLAHRILYLLDQGLDPRRTLVLMFNRAARHDFEHKLDRLSAGRYPHLPEIRTYHAMGLRLYRRLIERGDLPAFEGDVLSDPEIHWQLWRSIQQSAPSSRASELKAQKTELIELAATLLDRHKSTLKPLEHLCEDIGLRRDLHFLTEAVNVFEQWRRAQRRISYADMLHEPVRALERNPALLPWIANRVDMILVDEYQDTNEVQHRLLRAIAGDRAKVTVVGDPDQTIYEFRGADPRFILSRFREDYPETRPLQLSVSFRYGPAVAALANRLIHHNRDRKAVHCVAHPDNPDTRVTLLRSRDPLGALMSRLQSLLASGTRPGEIAILFRVWSQAVPIELACLAAGVPYTIDHGKGALNDRDVRLVLSLVEVAAGRVRSMSRLTRSELFAGLLRFPHTGLKEDALRALAEALARLEGRWGDRLEGLMPAGLHGLQRYKLRRFAQALQQLENHSGRVADALLDYARDTELYRGLRDLALTREQGEERINIVKQTIAYIQGLDGDAPATLTHFDTLLSRSRESSTGDRITLASMHRTKGLEWPCVLITGLSSRYLPYPLRGGEDELTHIEAERRLLYVAITRCREQLTLIAPPEPAREATTDTEDLPSPFVAELAIETTAEPRSPTGLLGRLQRRLQRA